MAHIEVTFKLQHECPYNAFSKVHPAVVISHWCNWSRDVLEIAHIDLRDTHVQRNIHELTRALGTKVIRRSSASSNLQIVLQHCACDRIPPPTLPVIEGHNCLELQPAVYTEGWEWYRVIAFSEKDLRQLFKELDAFCKLEITTRRVIPTESIRDTLLISTATLFGELTSKQRRALIYALDQGYYRMPRRATAGDIAKRLGVPRTSYVDHLRKAENKILQAVGSYLRLNPTVG
jgi:predicted DNA binding protein